MNNEPYVTPAEAKADFDDMVSFTSKPSPTIANRFDQSQQASSAMSTMDDVLNSPVPVAVVQDDVASGFQVGGEVRVIRKGLRLGQVGVIDSIDKGLYNVKFPDCSVPIGYPRSYLESVGPQPLQIRTPTPTPVGPQPLQAAIDAISALQTALPLGLQNCWIESVGRGYWRIAYHKSMGKTPEPIAAADLQNYRRQIRIGRIQTVATQLLNLLHEFEDNDDDIDF